VEQDGSLAINALCELGVLDAEDNGDFVNARLLETGLRINSGIVTASSQEIPLSQVSCSSYAAPELNVVNAAFLAPSAASSVESTPLMSRTSGVVVTSSVDAGASLQLPLPALSVDQEIPDLFLSPSPRSENFERGKWGEPNFNPEGSVPVAARGGKKKGAAETSLPAEQKPKGPLPIGDKDGTLESMFNRRSSPLFAWDLVIRGYVVGSRKEAERASDVFRKLKPRYFSS